MRYVALFRGINVGGKTTVRMERLRELLSDLGFGNVRSYIQSGNVAVDSDDPEESIEARIYESFEREFFRTPVMVRSIDSIRDAVDANPFANEEFEDKQMHLVFLSEAMNDEKAAFLLSHNNETESFSVRGREVYCLLRAGVADSLLGKKFIDNKLKIAATGRNWRTVKTLLTL
ncbi:MAG: DUF1697 domain-containing protein [Acidobacteria bacterium]|nr:DUF1697 domain-containing protein [Acidobacteriota bacterium]MBK8813058.1 DUF1697 domain-containing protein [Acidobacteriota bacterium]